MSVSRTAGAVIDITMAEGVTSSRYRDMDRDFLFGVFAVQLGFTRPDAVMAAASAWLADKSQPIPARLAAGGALTSQQLTMLEGIVEQAVKAHGGDVKKTLDTLGGDRLLFTSFGGSMAVDAKGGISVGPAVDRTSDSAEDAAGVVPEAAGRYRVGADAELGRGGIGRVLVAFDEFVGRDVAVKELLSDGPGSMGTTPKRDGLSRTGALAARFLREARVTGQLEHPNIVPVYEIGQRDSGAYYYTMKVVRGRTLGRAIRACSSLGARLGLLRHYIDLCHAVAYAHSRGVIHRDIKTENVMLGEFGETVVLDWGLAKVKGKKDLRGGEIQRELMLLQDAAAGATIDGAAVGTPAYMSPEQADGQIDELDERSDVWSLGAVLFEILTGHTPFEGVTPFEILGKVLKDDVPLVAALEPGAPPELGAVVAKALRRDKAERYSGAKPLADDVAAYLSGGRVAVYRYSSWELVKSFVAQNKALSSLMLLVVFVVAASSVVLYLAYRNEGRAKNAAQQSEARAQESERTAELNLAAALQEKADRLFDERRLLASRIYSAAALVHHPCRRLGLASAADCEGRFPHGTELRTRATSNVVQTSSNTLARPDWQVNNESPFMGFDLSPSSQRLVTLDDHAKVRLWDVRSRRALLTLEGRLDARPRSVAISPDGELIATCDSPDSIALWDVQGKPMGTLRQDKGAERNLAFSPDGTVLAATSSDGTIALWSVGTRQLLRALKTGRVGRTVIAFSPDGKVLASTARDSLLLWDTSTGKRLRTIDSVNGGWGFAFSPDGRQLAVGTVHRTVQLVDVEAGVATRTLLGHLEGIKGVAFSPDGTLLVSGSGDKTLRLWDTRTYELRQVLEGHAAPIVGVRFLPGGRAFVSADEDGALRAWRVDREAVVPSLVGHTKRVWTVEFSRDGGQLVSASGDGTVRLWDVARAAERNVVGLRDGEYTSASFSPDGKLLVTGKTAGGHTPPDITLWDSGTGRAVRTIDAVGANLFSSAMSPDGRFITSRTRDGSTELWESATGQRVSTLESDGAGQGYVVFSPDGRALASGGADNSVRLYRVPERTLLKALVGHPDLPYNFAFSADGRQLLSGGMHGTIMLWDVESGRSLRSFVGHQRWINSVGFVPGRPWVTSASDDGTVRLWSTATGENLLILRTSTEGFDCQASPDGKTMAVINGTQIDIYPLDLSILEADPEQLLRQAERDSGMKLDGFALGPAAPALVQ